MHTGTVRVSNDPDGLPKSHSRGLSTIIHQDLVSTSSVNYAEVVDSEDDDEEKGEIDGAKFLLRLPVVLPPAPQAWALLQEYLVDFNKAVPLFDEERLVNLYGSAFSDTPGVECVELKGIYSTLAIAYRLRAMSPLASDADDHNARSFVEQTSVALPRILVAKPSLPSAQYLTAMAVVMHGTHDPQGTRSLLAAALRMLLDLSPRSIEYDEQQACRVFWIASNMDIDLAMRIGSWSSTTLAANQIYNTLPHTDNIGVLPLDNASFPFFRHRVELTRIQNRFFQYVSMRHGVQINSLNSQELPVPLQAIIADISAWRRSDAVFRASPEDCRQRMHRSDLVHLMILEAAYFNTLFLLQGAQYRVGPFNGSVLLHLHQYCAVDFEHCTGDAVRLLRLFNLLPHGDFAFVWLVLEAVACAVYVLFHSAVRPTGADDLDSTAQPLQLLRELLERRPQKRLRAALGELDRLHDAAVRTITH